MADRRSWLVPGWILASLLAATFTLCRFDGDLGLSGESRPPLSYLSKLLTVPLTLTGPAELRYYVVPLAAAGLLLISGAGRPLPVGWLEILASIACGAATASALWNGTWGLSRGWILELFCGCLTAVLLARRADSRAIGRTVSGAQLVAFAAIACTLWHRHVRGIQDVRWPVGPVTLTAALGATWAAVGLGRLAAGFGPGGWPTARRAFAVLGQAVVLVMALSILALSARRGAWLGLVAAAAFVLSLELIRRLPLRATRVAVLLAVCAGIGLTAAWAGRELHDPRPEISRSLSFRVTYLRRMLDWLPQVWPLGIGPDQFVCRMTSELARARAETPYVLHGAIDDAAHNEWLQAVCELGVAGGMAYAAMPLLAAVLAARAWLRSGAGRAPSDLLACAAGLLAVVVVEATSVNLRNPTLPAWYWALLGLTAAALRQHRLHSRRLGRAPPSEPPTVSAVGPPPPRDPAASLLRSRVPRLAAVGLALAIAASVAADLPRAMAHARGRTMTGSDDRYAASLLGYACDRLGTVAGLKARFDRGVAESNVARALSPPRAAAGRPPRQPRPTETDGAPVPGSAEARDWASRAAATWRELYARCPGYPEAGGRLAEALLIAGDAPAAEKTLASYLRDVNPYDASAQLLQAEAFAATPAEKLEALQRGLRAGAVDEAIERLIRHCFPDASAPAAWSAAVAAAQRGLTGAATASAPTPLAPEVLRIEAYRREAAGDLAGAVEVQRLAAEAYGRLADEESPVRRPTLAETDAWQRAAELVFRADPGRYEQAYRLVCAAERFAVYGVAHEAVAQPDPNGEYVGGQVIPTELPERLRPLWRLSAKLHLAAGEERDLSLRILSSLPPEQWTPAAVERETQALAAELVEALGRLPPERRPPNMARLEALAGTQTEQPHHQPTQRREAAPADRG